MAAAPVVRAVEENLDRRLGECAEAAENGASILIRPRQDYPDVDHVVRAVRTLSPAPVFVTDLAEHAVLWEPLGEGTPTEGPLLCYHTSGSTGAPKCVVYDRARASAHHDVIARTLGLGEDDAETTYVALPPPGFAYGQSIVGSHARAGVPVTFAPVTWGLPELAEILEHDDGPVALYLLPQHVPSLLAAPVRHDRFARFVVAGGRLSQASVDALAEACPSARLTNMYGQAELGPRLAMWDGPLRDFTEGEVGHPLPGVSLRLDPESVHEDLADTTGAMGGEDAGADVGVVQARTPYAASYVLSSPYLEATPGAGPEGYSTTGDLGRIRADGTLVHHGRADHVCNVAGTKVDLRKVADVVDAAFRPLVVRTSARAARLGGDAVPVVELVPSPNGDAPAVGAVKRALHAEFGALVTMFDIHVVETLQLKESGK